MDPYIFADSDPGSLNVADITDPDPKHFKKARREAPRPSYLQILYCILTVPIYKRIYFILVVLIYCTNIYLYIPCYIFYPY